MSNADVYQQITDRIIAELEQGTVPWHKPWNAGSDAPRSLATGKPYRGINSLLLALEREAHGYANPYWATYRQVAKQGGQVRRGEKSSPVVLWKFVKSTDKSTGETRSVPFLRYFNVFNVDQCDGCSTPPLAVDREHTPVEAAELIVQGYAGTERGPRILPERGDAAYYQIVQDTVQLPKAEHFEDVGSYYSTLFHELTHSTGHESRLNRTFGKRFGDQAYATEELTAELGACFLLAEAELQPQYQQSAAYLDSWLKALRAEPRMVITAAGAAQKAADLILNRTWGKEDTDD